MCWLFVPFVTKNFVINANVILIMCGILFMIFGILAALSLIRIILFECICYSCPASYDLKITMPGCNYVCPYAYIMSSGVNLTPTSISEITNSTTCSLWLPRIGIWCLFFWKASLSDFACNATCNVLSFEYYDYRSYKDIVIDFSTLLICSSFISLTISASNAFCSCRGRFVPSVGRCLHPFWTQI